MNISIETICLGLYLLFVGAANLGLFSVSNTVLGVLAIIAGLVLLIDSYHSITWRRSPQS
jgi:hypothetical protein